MDPFNKLPPEQQTLVRQSFQLAQSYYDAQNAELCRAELSKIKGIMPDYEKSYWGKEVKSLDQTAEQIIFIRMEAEKLAIKEKEQAEAEAKIQQRTTECRAKLNPNMTKDEMDSCLESVILLNPSHPQIEALKVEVAQIESAREIRLQQQKDYQELVEKLRRLYSQAEKTEKSGRLLDAIEEYRKVVGSSLPDPNGLKSRAQRNLAGIKSQIGSKTSSLVGEAEKQAQSKNYKQAILSLRKARNVNPLDEEIPEKIEGYVRDLRKEMKALWDEAILEESFGKVMPDENNSGAVGKWKKIIELDIADGEFYLKAKTKLKKYGAN